MVFKALLGNRSRDDVSSRGSVRRKSSTTGGGDSRTSSRRQSKISSASSVSSSRRSTRGDDRDRGLGDISASRSVTGDSTTTYVTAEPTSYVDEPLIIERTPRSDRGDDRQRTSRDTDRDSKRRSERRYTEERSSRDDTNDRDRTRPRTKSEDTAAHFAAEISDPRFNQFPMQYDSSNIPGTSAPYHPPLDSHIPQQFPGQLPDATAQPYMSPNPAGYAADYYNDQGQSVAHQPGVRPQAPDIIVGSQPHLHAASAIANPPPEPSSLGQVGAAAEYYAAGDSFPSSTTPTSSKPPKPSKPSKTSSRPPKPTSGVSIAGESTTFGIGSELMNQASSNFPITSGSQSMPLVQATGGTSSSHNGVGLALGGAAAGAAAAYMLNHHNDQSNSNMQYANRPDHHNDSYGIGIPPSGNINSSFQGNLSPYAPPGYANRPPLGPSYASGGMQPGSLAYHQQHHGPLSAFIDFWRDPEGVGKFEEYTEAIGVCKYCFEPGTSSRDAPRKHHYNRRRRSPVVDRYGSSSRVDKLTRYNSSEDESRRKKSKGSSWLAGGLAGGLAGYVAKSLFSNKDFEDTYSVSSGTRVESSRRHTYDEESMVSSSKASSTSRGVISKKRSSDDKGLVAKDSKSYRYSRRSSRSRSRSTSRDRRTSSGLKEAAIGAAVGSALTAAATRSSERNRSPDRSIQRHRRRQSDSSGSVNFERSRRRGRSSPRGFRSFFTAPSANRRKKSSKKERGFFSFGNSSSSSGDFDLAFGGSEIFGSTVSGRSSRSNKSSKKHNVDAEILGLGLAARQLAHSSSRKEISPRDLARPPNYARPTKVEDDGWEDADSSDSSVSANLAYGGSAIFGSQEPVTSGSSFWPWGSSSRKQNKAQRQYPQTPPTNDYSYYPTDYASQDGSSGRGSLQQVYPVPTSDPSRFDVVRMSTSSSPNVQPPLVRPGPIPLQQPQPVTPVSQSVYYPTVTAPIDPLVQRIGLEDHTSRDIQRHRRSNSSPVLPIAPLDGPSPGILKRRSTAKDPATVSFDLTEEQTDRQQEVDRRDKERLERRREEEFAVLREEADELAELERRRERKEKRREERRRREEAEAEEAAREARRERRRKESKVDDRPSVSSNGERKEAVEELTRKDAERKETSSSSWVTPAIVGAGAAAVAGVLAEKAFEDDGSSASTSRYEERREKRRSERRSASETQSEVTEAPRQEQTQQVVEDDEQKKQEQRIARIAASRIVQHQSPTAHESYEDFFMPEDLRHHESHDDSSPNIIEVVPRSERAVEPYLGSDLDKPDPSWPPLVINIIKPTPPGSYDGSVRDVHSPVPTSEPTEKEKKEPKDDVESTPSRPTTGSRVSWGEHQTHEYEVETPISDREEHFEETDQHEAAVSSEHREDVKNYEIFAEEKPVPRHVDETESDSKHSMPGSFDDDVEFAATLAAGAEIAGFDPAVVTDDASYYSKDHLSKASFKDTYRPPAVESVTDLGDANSVFSASARKDFHKPESFDFQNAHTEEKASSQAPSKTNQDVISGTRSIAVTEPEDVDMSKFLDRQLSKELRDDTGDSVPLSPVGDESQKTEKSKRRSKTLEDFDIELEEHLRRSASNDNPDSKRLQGKSSASDDVDFEATLKRVQSAPVTDDWIEEDKERRRRKSKRSSLNRAESVDDARSVAASAPGADELEEYRSRRSSRRSKNDDEGDLEDDTRSLPDADDDGERRRRRKHKRHSGNFDDAASVASSPAKIDETREKRRSRDSSTASKERSKEPEKKSGGLFSSIFGSKTNPERSSSTSGKRETQSEVGVEDRTSERRRKKRSSSGRSVSGDGAGEWDVASEAALSTMDRSQLGKALDGEEGDNDSQSSRRKRREKRRDRYEGIVDSARDTSEKERYTTADDNDDDKMSFLGMRPEMPPVNSHEEDPTREIVGGASGLAITAAGLEPMISHDSSLEDQLQVVQQRLRSRSVSPSTAEKTFELAPRSQSRPSSPGGNQEEKDLRARRLSLLRTNDSPTAVPLHFRKPPTSPNSSRRVSMTSPAQSPSSPKPGHRRPNSVEFKNVREIRPLWLVERHSTSKLDVEPEGPLPSLPSSKTSSRSPSVENLREGFDEHEDAVTGFFMGGDSAYNWGRKPVDLRISTDRTPPEDEDFLNSQQATPTAETYNNKAFGPPPIKKEKPKYEFHSPSELLQDPTTYQSIVPQLPESLDRLPSVAGSDLGVKEPETKLEGAPIVESVREVEEPLPSHNTKDEDQSEKQKSGMSSFLAGAGFASVVDAAVSAAVSDREPVSNDIHEYEAASKDLKEEAPHHSMIEDASNQEQAPSSKPQSVGDFGDVVDAAVAAAVSEHASHNEIHTDRDQSMKAEEGHVAEDVAQEHNARGGGLFAGVVDAAVAAAAAAAASGETHAEVAQPELAEDVELREDTAQDQKTEEIPTAEPSTEEESKVVAEEATTEPSSGSTSKKQKRKDKKKKKKSKDLDVTAEDNDEQETVAVPAVELDSSAQPNPEAEAEAERAEPITELTNEPSTFSEQQPVSDGTEVKDDALEIPSDQPLTGVSEEVVEDNTGEIQPSTSNVETEAVTASAENEETQLGPSAEPTITTTTTDTNDQSPHVAAEPEEDGATTPSKSSKKKKKNKKKSQSLSESGSVDIPATPVEESQVDASVTVTEEPQSIYEVAEEKPAPETSSTSMPSENLETTEDVSTSEEKQQIDENEPGLSESTERSVVDKDNAVADTTEQDAQGTLGIEQEKSLDSPVDEWFDSAETAKAPPTELAEAAQDATDKEILAPEVSQDTAAVTEPVETKQAEEPAATTSSSKKKNKKKKKKGQSQSVDESTSQEIAQVPSETVLSQPDSAEVPSVAAEGEVAQASDADGQSKDIGESIVEEARQEASDSLTSEVEQVPQKSEDASTSAVRETEPTTADAENVTEAVAESESLPSAPVPEHNEETVELQASDTPVEPISSETLQSEGDAVPPEQSTKDNEAAGVTPKEEEVSLPSKEASDEVSVAPVKSKKKKGKKGKRVSWAEEPELATESEPVTPAEPDTTPASEDTASAVVSEDPFPTVGEETTIPVSAEPESSTIPEDVPQEVERDMLTPAEPVDSAPPLSTDVEPTPTSEAQKEPSTEPQPEQQIQGVESLDDQPVSLPSESSQLNDAKELSEEAIESQGADSKSKRKKDKKKDKKKKKAAESSLVADEEPSQPSESPVNKDTKDIVEDATPEVSVPVENTPAEQPVAEEQTTDTVPPDAPEPQAPEMPEPVDLTPAEQPTAEGETTDVTPADAPEATEPTESTPVDQPAAEERPSDVFPEHASAPEAPEASEPSELTPVDQPTAEEQTSGIVPEDASEPQTPEATADEVKSADMAQDNDDELAQETSKSKKKKDKKKKKAAAAAAAAAAALSVDQDPSDPPLTEESKEAAEIAVSDNADQTQDTTAEQSNSDDLKEVSVVEPVAEQQILEEAVEKPAEDAVKDPVQEPVDELMQESVQEPVEEAKLVEEVKLVEPADDVPAQETSKSKKKKDKKKKKAAEALLQDEEPAPKEETADPTAATSSVAPEQTESVPQEQQLPDEPKTEDVIAAENEERRPLEVAAEEVKPTEAVIDDEWAQETSKSKNKKDKKKKKAAAALSVDEESTPSETVVEEAEANPSEAEPLIPQDQPILDEETAGITENQDAELRPVEGPAEEVKSTEVAEDDEWAQETSKSKKKKDKKKKRAAEAPSLSEEPAPPSETVVEEVQEKPTEVEVKPDVPETKEERILDEEKKDVTEDLNAEPQATEEPAEDVKAIDNAEDDGLVQETSSKSKKKKDKKKKKAEALSWDDEPQTPVKEELAEAAETVLLQAQDMPAVEEQQSGDVSKDEDAKPETTENPVEDVKAVAVAEEDELAQETSSKSKKKKDKKKKKAAEALPWDEEPASSDRPIDEQAPANAKSSASQAQEDSLVDDKKPDDATEVQSTETPIPETPTEEMKQVDAPEDDNLSQDTSKSKKKKDKKKNRKSLQLEVAQEENTPDVTVGETKDILGTTPEVEPTSISEDATAAVDEQREADTADVQSQAAPQDELVPVQAESIEDETSTSKSGKSKKKKGKKNKSKDEPMPWDEEPSVKTSDSQQETSADRPTVTEISPVQESARENLEPTEQDELEPTEQPIQQPLEPTEDISKDTELSASTEVEASERTLPTELEQLEQSQLPTDTPVSVQPEEPANQNPLNATELAESEPPAKSGKKSKKKKKRESMLLDDESTEQQDSPTIPIAVNGEDQTTIEDEQPEPTPTGEVQPQQETGVIESKGPDSTDANVDPNIEDSGAAVIEPIKQLSAKEKRKEKKKKRRTLDLADSEPNPAIADEVPEAAAPVEQSLPDEQQKDDEGAPDEFAVVGKKKGKKSKKQSVSWEDEVIQAVAEDDTKPDKTGDPEHAQVTEEQQLDSDSKNPPLSEHTDLDSGPSQTENELQETPVEVEGKQTFQSSEETYTDQREKDFDWTDNMVSPQVQSQTEESLFPVPSPISDEREDPDQSRPTTVDDSQSHETVIPETVVEDQPAASEQEREGPTEISPADVQVIDQETEDIDWTASKSKKKNKKKKKQKSIDTVPDDSMIAAEETSSKTPVEEDEKPEFTEQQVVNTEPLETIQEQSVVQDEPLVSEPEPQMEVNVEEEFKPVGSSKKKGKKNKKKSDTWPSEELGEPASDQNTEEAPARSPNDIVEGETIATDNDKIQMPEDTPLPPETAQEEVVEDTTSKDAPEILSEVPDDTPLVTETVQEEVVEDTISKDAIVIPDEVPDNTPLVTGIAQEEVVEDTTSKDAIVIPDEVPDNTPLITETPQEGVVEDTTSKDAPEILSEVPENAPLAPETVQEGVVEDMTSKDVTEIPLEVPENAPVAETVQEEVVEDVTVKDATVIPEQGKSLPQEGFPESEATPFPEPPTRKLSKKEKRKMKKGKKAGFEEEEPAADIVEKEQAETVLSEHVPEATEEKGDSVSAADDTLIVIDKSTDIQPMIEEATTTTEEPQVSDANVETTPVQEESLARKPSKKEKRKNKKRMTEDRPEEEPLEASTADNAGQPEAVELITTDGQEKNPDGDFATEASLSGEQPEHVHVSLDPFDVPEAEDEGPNNPSADLVIDNDLAERVSEPELDAEAALRARQLEKEADLAVAASLFGESPEPEPEQVISRQLSKKQKGKKNKKDKKNVPVEPPKEGSVQEERHETKPSGSIEEISRSWPSVEFDNDLSQTYSTDKNAHEDNELEPERQVQHSETSVQDPASIIDDFRVEETHEEAPRLKSDIQPVDMEEASQQGHRSHSPSQKEDVDMIISATMAAAGFLPSAVTAPAGADAFIETKSTSGTSRELSDIYEHRDVFSDNQMHSKSSHTTLETSEGGSKSSKIANIFPGLERVKYREPSPKLHEKQAENTPTVEERKLPVETPVKIVQDTQPTHHVSSRELPVTEVESMSKDRSSSLLFDSSPSTRLEPTPDTTRRASSSQIRLQRSNDPLHRTKSIHGQRSGRTHSWQLEDDLTPTKRASSQSPRPLLHADHLDLSPPRTPLDPIKEHLPSPSPRLLMGEGPYKLERPDSRASVRSSRSLRRTNRSISGDLRAAASLSSQTSHDWSSADVDTDGHKKGKAGRQDVGHPQPLNPQQRRDNFHSDNNHHHSDDDDDFDRQRLENIPSSSKYDPVTDKGKRPVRGMSDVYEGWGETPNSPRSPTRPPSIRRRQSMQHLQELETRLDQLISENRLLAAAKEDAEKKLSRVGVARRKSDQALNTSNADLRDKEAEIARLTGSLEWMQSEVQRLTQENEVVNAKHAELTASHAREVDSLRTRQLELASGMEGIVREQISAALAEKDAELRRLRDELAAARQAVQELQQQIVAATADDVLSIHDEDYFDNSCQRLCQHVQQWVLRFSKHSDLRRCRPLSEVRNTNVADRFDNAILDGSDIDAILADRVRRRDVFVAVVMAMVWEYVFTRYLFGMDREQRQKLKALEKQLSEIGPRRAVSHWRALTLTLLAKRPSFADQRVRDTEAVALEIMETLSQLLPPPQSAQSQLLESLRGVIRRAANLSIEMRTQRAEYVMLPPLQPEYDSQGDLARQVNFNASLMNERSGIYSSNEALEAQGTAVRLVLFPLVVKKGNDLGDGDEEIVVCPAQVLVAWPENEKSRERDRMSTLGNRSVSSVVPSVDMGNAI